MTNEIARLDAMKVDARIRATMADFLHDVRATDREIELFQREAILAGGAIASILLNETPKDYDVYFLTQETAELFRSKVERSGKCVSASEFASLHECGVQIVSKFYGTPSEVIYKFDFKHARNYWTFETGLNTNPESLRLVFAKKLEYNPHNEYPLSSIMRVVKFAKRGWSIGLKDMLLICFNLQQYDLTDADTLITQTKGVDPNEITRVIDALKAQQTFDMASIATIVDDAWEIPF